MKKYARILLLVRIWRGLRPMNTACLATTTLLVCTMQFATAQSLNQTKIDVDFKNIPMKQALDLIQKKSNLNFVFSEEMVAEYKVTLSGKAMTVKQVLDKLLSKTSLDYTSRDNKVIIRKKAAQVEMKTAAPRSVPMTGMGVAVSSGRLKGLVLDAEDRPLSGVNVRVKNQSALTVQTNEKGEFTIMPPEGSEYLVFSSIGFVTKEVKIGSTVDFNVTLVMENKDLESVVVTGVFTRKAESFTGAASTFTQEQLRSVGNQNIFQSLKMLDPSFIQVENLQMGSNPNALPDLQIRGANSLPDVRGEYSGSPNMPLFILDGFESSLQKIYDLDINRVASVTILKDAAAKAIYGSRAANGVVVVETKRPEMGKLRLSYTGDFNVTTPDLSSYSLANAAEKLQVELDAGRFSNPSQVTEQRLREQYNSIYSDVYRGVNTDWLAQPVRNAIGQKHTLSLEGGDQYLRYGADFTYNDIAGVMKESGRRNLSGNVFLSYRLNNFLFRNTLMVTGNNGYDSPYGPYSAYSRLNPYWTPYEANGQLKKVLGQFTPSSGATINTFNPLYDASLGTKNFSKYTDITNNFITEWSLDKSLKVIGRLGYTQKIDSREDFYPANHTRFIEYAEADFFRRGQYSITDGKDGMIKTDLTLNYNKLINKHLFFFNAGVNLLETKRDAHGMTAEGFLNDRVDNINFALQYLQNGRPSGSDALKRETGILGALNYSYDERYLADLTFRRQGSSVFGANNRWGNFWSMGIGWNIHREAFMSQQEWLEQLKLRASTGYTGNQEFNPYQAMATYNYYTDSYYDNVVGAKLMGLANEDLKWQQTMDYNFGVDASVFNRVNLRFDYYISRTSNLLTDLGLPGSVGFSTVKENLGELQNTGVDAVMSVRALNDQSTGSFLNIFLNVGMNKNKLLKISEGLSNLNSELETERGTSTKPFTRYQEGQSITTLWAVESLGIDPINGAEIFRKRNGETTYVWDANDQVPFGDTNPKLRGSFGFNAQYKGWGLNCGFTYRIGGQSYNQTLVDRVENVDIRYNVDRRVFTDTWKQPGDQVFFKRITERANRTNPSSRFVQNFHELQLGSLNASYDFRNTAVLKQLGMQRLRVTLFTNEIARVSSVRAERGLDFPFARTYSCSLQATF
ncbi:SusC/RagA family TonB-linked outer membrane protein [Pedobacter sp. GR22-6]|uniref:SusC/RagA family TonB-linked outer membrane protein n=1 Tax=Pedobacter sp. GR22-6 TaxID=3127957 RepID=UPI00307D45BE